MHVDRRPPTHIESTYAAAYIFYDMKQYTLLPQIDSCKPIPNYVGHSWSLFLNYVKIPNIDMYLQGHLS